MEGVYKSDSFTIDTQNPEMHSHPSYCRRCECFYYFNHVCITKKMKDAKEAFRRGQLGFFDGAEQERDEDEQKTERR